MGETDIKLRQLGLDVVARACLRLSDETLSTAVAPTPRAFLNTDGGLVRNKIRVIAVDTDEMTAEIVLATEGATAAGVTADKVLDAVGVVGGHVCLEVEGTSEGCRKENRRWSATGCECRDFGLLTSRACRALVLATGVDVCRGRVRAADLRLGKGVGGRRG